MVKQYRNAAILAVVIILATVGAVAAQDYIYSNFRWGYVDHELPPAPCVGPSQVFTYDTSVWVYYDCGGRTIARRFFHPNDTGRQLPQDEPRAAVPAPVPVTPVTVYDSSNPNWNGTGMTEAEWRLRYPVR